MLSAVESMSNNDWVNFTIPMAGVVSESSVTFMPKKTELIGKIMTIPNQILRHTFLEAPSFFLLKLQNGRNLNLGNGDVRIHFNDSDCSLSMLNDVLKYGLDFKGIANLIREQL
jgi:hypothetical protein